MPRPGSLAGWQSPIGGVAKRTASACIYVLAGPNGAGKSSVVGAAIREKGADYFNPDEATRRIRAANPDISQRDANSAAWQHGRRLLEKAIAERLEFAMETTLGGDTIAALLRRALADTPRCACGTWHWLRQIFTSHVCVRAWRKVDTTFQSARFGSVTIAAASIFFASFRI